MQYEKVGELLARRYYGGDISSDAGLETIDFSEAVQSAYAYRVKLDYWNTVKMTGEKTVNQAFLTEFLNVKVDFNEDTETYYSKLPAQVLDLPNNAGIVISQMKNPQNQFAPQSLGQSYIFSRNPIDTITYHRDKTNVYYDNFDSSIESVYMQFPPLFAEDIPDEFVTEIMEIVMNQFLKAKGQPEDKINDNNPAIVQPNQIQ